MKFPQINKQPSRTIRVPDLAGGLNIRDSVSMVNDNQLTDCLNMWYKDGILKTRPGMRTSEDLLLPITPLHIGSDAGSRAWDIYKTQNGKQSRLLSYYFSNSTYTDVFFAWVDKEAYEKLPHIIVNTGSVNFFAVQHKSDVYIFMSGYGIKESIYKLSEDESTWVKLSDDDLHIPLVMTNCVFDLNGDMSGGTQVEGYNLIGHKCKFQCSSVNKSLLSAEVTSHEMCYGLLYDKKDDFTSYAGMTVKVIHTKKDGTTGTHQVVLDAEGNGAEAQHAEDNLKLTVNKMYFYFDEWDGYGAYSRATVTASDYVENNMTVIQPCANSQENIDKVFGMTQTEWFGGAAAGLSGGTRLFLGGNKNTKEKSLLLWSDLNKPLYFPENCYAYVGNSNSSVTAFGKQSDNLIIFKEFEIFYTYYVQNTDISAEDLINQTVVDYTANRAYFPIIQLNASIGCDCPNSVQLCRNRLVWANSDGNVYTLVSNSQYNERNIYPVSDMIMRQLVTEENLQEAVACDWNGYYVLMCKKHVYVMDYNSYGYQYVSSYSKSEDANIRIPWYFWTTPNRFDAVTAFTISGRLVYFGIIMQGTMSMITAPLFVMDESLSTDTYPAFNRNTLTYDIESSPIYCYAVTKLFDFNTPNHRKNVDIVGLSLGNNGGNDIKISFLTESGTEDNSVMLESSDTELHTPGYIESVILTPSIRSVVRFGVKFECEGNMAIDGITINYRMLGGAR